MATAAARWLRFRYRRQVLLGGSSLVATLVGYQMLVEMGQVDRWGPYCVLLGSMVVFFVMRLRFVTALIVVALYGVVQTAAREQRTKVVLARAPSSLPMKSQFLRPTASRRSCSSLMLLWMGRRSSVRNRDSP